ncbi:MAG: symbiosis island integrase [Alphaproteobacteria bacterium]|nr:symbiosis island integrase [Alphaproteobacteria bacterium]
MALTDVKCRGAKPGKTRAKLSDGGGLQFWVQPNGSRLWQLVYQFQGKQAQMALGPYPQVSLIEARALREEAKAKIRAGIDPTADRRRVELAKTLPGDTFKEIALEFIEKCRRDQLAGPTMIKKEWLLDFAYPELGTRKVSEIKPVEVLKVVQAIEFKGNLETARRLRAIIGQVCRFAVATGRAEIDPTPVLRGAISPPKVTHRAAILDPKKFGGLLRGIESFDGQPTTIAALKLMALLFPRPGELRHAEWTEFDFEKSIWTIPAEKTKMRREHQIYLARQAVTILDDLRKITGHRKFLFPSFHGSAKPISENTLNVALRRMGYGQDEMTSHGFRATASTLLNESGKWSADAIERQLSHIEVSKSRGPYSRGSYWQERVRMMPWWADFLDKLRDGADIRSIKKAS